MLTQGVNAIEKLAIDGGTPVISKNPIVQTDYFTDEELNAVVDVGMRARWNITRAYVR